MTSHGHMLAVSQANGASLVGQRSKSHASTEQVSMPDETASDFNEWKNPHFIDEDWFNYRCRILSRRQCQALFRIENLMFHCFIQ